MAKSSQDDRAEAPETHDPHGLTILRALNSGTGAPEVMTKTFAISASGMVVMRPYNDRVTLFAVERCRAENIEELALLLRTLDTDRHAAVIRDAPLPGINWKRTDRLAKAKPERLAQPANGRRPAVKYRPARPATFAPVSCHIVPMDLDGLPIPGHMSVTGDPAEVVGWVEEMLADAIPELRDVAKVVKFSSSAGLVDLHQAAKTMGAGAPNWTGVVMPHGVLKTGGARVYFMSAVPLLGEQLKRWAQAVNARWGGKLLDPTLYDAVHLDFTAAPVFGDGLHDPLAARRVHVIEGNATATLVIPEVSKAKPRAEPADFGNFTGAGAGTAYGVAALAMECRAICDSGVAGSKHATLNRAAFAIGGLVGGGELEREAAFTALAEALATIEHACVDFGAAQDTLATAFADGMGSPRQTPPKPQAQAAEQAQPIEPTHPDRGVPLAEGERQAKAAVARFGDLMRAGETPEHLLRVTVGTGKSHATIQALPELLEAARTGQGMRKWRADNAAATEKARQRDMEETAERWAAHEQSRDWTPPERSPPKYGPPRPPEPGDGAIYFLTSRHDLADEIERRIMAATGMQAARWRGAEQPDPEQPGEKMCQDLPLLAEARRADVDASAVCKVCELQGQCGYQRQREQAHDGVVIGPREMLFQTKPRGLPSAAAVVVDEAFYEVAIEGADGKKRLAVSALDEQRTPNLSGEDSHELRHYRSRMKALLEAHEDGQLLRLALEAEGFGAESAKRWADLEWATKPDVELQAGMSRADLLHALDGFKDTGWSRRRAQLATMLREFLAGDDARAVGLTRATTDLGNGQGPGRVVELARRRDIAAWAADKPKMLLDATSAPELVRVWCPALETIDIEVAAPHQHVTQVYDKEFGKAWFKTASNVTAIADLVVTELARTDGEVLVILQQVAEDLVEAELARRSGALPARLHLAHHGALTGIDRWRAVDSIIVVGRPTPNRLTGERNAEVIRGGAVARVADANDAWWPQAEAGLRMADGTGQRVETSRHPDPLVEACRWTIAEAAVIQAIGRARGVRRTAGNPVRVLVLGNLALPMTVTTATTWEAFKPNPVQVAMDEAVIAGRALPLGADDLVAACPDTFRNAAQVWNALRGVNCNSLIRPSYKRFTVYSARYWKPGTFRPSMALVPAAGGQAELERVLGVKLARFEWIEQPPATEQASQAEPHPKPRARPTAKPEPMPEPAGAAVMVMGEAPPFDALPAPPPPPRQRDILLLRVLTPAPDAAAPKADTSPVTPDARERLASLSRRLFQVKPPRPSNDGMNGLRMAHWQDRCAEARREHWRGDLREAPMVDSA